MLFGVVCWCCVVDCIFLPFPLLLEAHVELEHLFYNIQNLQVVALVRNQEENSFDLKNAQPPLAYQPRGLDWGDHITARKGEFPGAMKWNDCF